MARKLFKTRIYVAGPISLGDPEQNVRKACEAARKLMQAGLAPFVPQLSAYFDGPDAKAKTLGITYDEWLEYDYSWLIVCQALLRLPGESVGADREVAFALDHDIPVYYSVETVIDQFANK